MAYLGRPSAGDSPFAIGDKAMKDKSSPAPPSQRNPTPRQQLVHNAQQAGYFGSMQAPSPYGSVSDEARRRYEERYAAKKAQEAAKATEEDRARAAEQMPPPGGPGLPNQGPPSGFNRPPSQQGSFEGGGGSGFHSPLPQAPGGGGFGHQQQHQQQYQLPQQPQNQYFNPQSHPQQPQQGYPQQQQQQQNYGQRPPSIHSPPIGYQDNRGGPSPQPPQQRWSNTPQNAPSGGPQWATNAVPPPSQQWNKPQSPPVPSRPSEDGELRNLFSQFDSSRTGQLNAYDLQRLLAKDATMEAREDCVKMLMNIFDTDRSGSINFMEFEGLYRYIQDWHGIFLRFDRDNSGLIDRKELHQALLGFGFSLPSEMVRKLEKRFAPPPIPGNERRGGISFDRFLMACVTVKHYTEAFRKVRTALTTSRADTRGEGRLTLDYNQFMGMILDAPS